MPVHFPPKSSWVRLASPETCSTIDVRGTTLPRGSARTTIRKAGVQVNIMSSPIEWDDGPVPSSDPSPASRDGRKRIEPLYPKQSCIVWFLTQPKRVLTHFMGTTWPHLKEGCPHCQKKPPEVSWYASVLLKTGGTDNGKKHVWEPRVLRVPDRNIAELSTEVVNKIYSLTIVAKGNVKRFRFDYRGISEPPMAPFSAVEVMEAIWFPHIRPNKLVAAAEVMTEVPDEQLPVAPRQEPSFGDHVKAMSNDELRSLFESLRRSGVGSKVMLPKVEAELLSRGFDLDIDLKTHTPGGTPGKPVTLHVYTAPMGEPKRDEAPTPTSTPAAVPTAKRKGGVA
jgi:hypothetical protein